MATHEHKFNGRRWVCLTSIESDDDRHLFENGRILYDQLFTEEIKEDYENYAEYIADSVKARRQPSRAKLIDTVSYGFEGAEMKGFLAFTWYPKLYLVFISYLGFRHTRSRRFFDTVPEVILAERNIIGLTGIPIDAAIFEMERFDPNQLSLGAKGLALTKFQRTALRRAKLTRRYQESGVWLIPWINYLQPPLAKGRRPLEMHLMYLPLDPLRRDNPSTFKRDDIRRLVEFTYENLYLDSYRSTEPRKDWPYWEALMKQYVSETTKYVPKGKIELDKISVDRTLETTFISYAGDDEDKAKVIEWRLKTRGSPVIIWRSDSLCEGGKTISNAVQEWMKKASNFVFLITSKSFLARGQRDEIKLLLEMEPSRRRVISQIITNIEHAQLEEMGFRVSGPEGKIYHRFKNDDDFVCAVDNCLASIIEARRITSE